MTLIQTRSVVPLLAGVAVLVLAGVQPARATETNTSVRSLSDAQKSEEIFRQQQDIFCRAFEIGDADIIASMWSKDGIMVDSSGQRFVGREAIKNSYKDFFAKNGAQPIVLAIHNISFPALNVAIEEDESSLPESRPENCRYTVVRVKHNGIWQVASVTEYPLAAAKVNSNLKDLDWLVGNWTAQGKDGAMPFHAEWISNDNFLRCVYFADDKAQIVKGMKVIGWNPIRQQMVVWHFSSDGSYGVGALTKQGADWVEHSSSVQADGSNATATYTVKQIDKDKFTWQSMQRQMNGEQLPDTSVVNVTRNK